MAIFKKFLKARHNGLMWAGSVVFITNWDSRWVHVHVASGINILDSIVLLHLFYLAAKLSSSASSLDSVSGISPSITIWVVRLGYFQNEIKSLILKNKSCSLKAAKCYFVLKKLKWKVTRLIGSLLKLLKISHTTLVIIPSYLCIYFALHKSYTW